MIKKKSIYNFEIECEKLMWEAHSQNKLIEFQQLVKKYELITDRSHALIIAYRRLISKLI